MVKISVKNVARLAATAGLGMSLAFSVAPAVALADDAVPVTNDVPAEDAENTATLTEVGTADALKAAVADPNVTSIKLTADITLDETLVVSRPVTINGGGHSITASDTFAAKKHLVSVQGISESDAPVILTNLTLKTGSNNRHALNIWKCKCGVELNNVTLDHTVCEAIEGGAPLVINNTAVTVTGKLTTITGANSWYAVNVDSQYGDTSFTVDTDKGGSLEASGSKTGVVAENSQKESAATEEDLPTVDLGFPKGETVEIKNEENGQITTARAVAHIGETNYASLAEALAAANAAETPQTIELYTNVETGKFTLSKAVTIDGNGFTITNTDAAAAGGTFVTVMVPGVTLQNVTLNTENAYHGVQFYKVAEGMLDGVTINGGTGTSVLVNGSTVTIKDCKLNPATGAYANVEESSADLDAYPDAGDATAYAVEALEWATENDVLMGFGSGELAPTGQLNRAMLAAMLMRLDA